MILIRVIIARSGFPAEILVGFIFVVYMYMIFAGLYTDGLIFALKLLLSTKVISCCSCQYSPQNPFNAMKLHQISVDNFLFILLLLFTTVWKFIKNEIACLWSMNVNWITFSTNSFVLRCFPDMKKSSCGGKLIFINPAKMWLYPF